MNAWENLIEGANVMLYPKAAESRPVPVKKITAAMILVDADLREQAGNQRDDKGTWFWKNAKGAELPIEKRPRPFIMPIAAEVVQAQEPAAMQFGLIAQEIIANHAAAIEEPVAYDECTEPVVTADESQVVPPKAKRARKPATKKAAPAKNTPKARTAKPAPNPSAKKATAPRKRSK